ncbi:MAG: glycosyltransferase [Candidatus Natronoplasma sp.]
MVKETPVSVIINVYNEEENIEDCLDSLLDQTYDDFELLVVDDGSTDDTMEIVERYSEKFNLNTCRTEHIGLQKARKMGVDRSTGDIVIIVDADEIFKPDFLENMLSPFSDGEVGAVGGMLKSVGEGWVTDAYGALNEIFYTIRTDGEEVDWIQGGCSAFRKEALEETGGLTTEDTSEDKDISWKLKNAGWKVVLSENAVAYHKDPQTLGSLMKREYDIGKREYLLLKDYKERFGLKELSRFYPLFGLVLLVFVPFYRPLGVLLLIGVISSMIGVAYLIHKNVEDSYFGISVKSWIVLTMINLAWSLGFLFSRD